MLSMKLFGLIPPYNQPANHLELFSFNKSPALIAKQNTFRKSYLLDETTEGMHNQRQHHPEHPCFILF
jgi:hypothetical protein